MTELPEGVKLPTDLTSYRGVHVAVWGDTFSVYLDRGAFDRTHVFLAQNSAQAYEVRDALRNLLEITKKILS